MNNSILGMDHIALIVSSEESLKFYELFGSKETRRVQRLNDIVVFMENKGNVLELFVDLKHSQRLNVPEAYGLRHLSFIVDNFDDFTKLLECCAVTTDWNGRRTTFCKDPDGFPIELKELAR